MLNYHICQLTIYVGCNYRGFISAIPTWALMKFVRTSSQGKTWLSKKWLQGPADFASGYCAIYIYIYNYMHNVILYQSWYIYIYVYNTIIVYSNTTIIIIVIVISMYIYIIQLYIYNIYIYIHEPAKTKCRVLRWFEHTGPPSPFKCNKIAKQKPPLNVSWRCIPLWNGFYTQ